MSKYQNILITGASSGIGRALAIHYASFGAANLFLCGRDSERLKEAAEKCQELGSAVYPQVLDVTDTSAVEKWITECNQIAPLHLVFANAGVSTVNETPDNIRHTFATNINGVVNTVLPAVELFKNAPKTQPKHLVITSSIAGYHGLPACPSYSASKAFLKAWGEALRIDLQKRYAIKVSTIAPGFVRSRITDKNTCPMPFLMDAAEAAAIIAENVEKNTGLIAFPWQMRFCAWAASILPSRISEILYRFLPYKV